MRLHIRIAPGRIKLIIVCVLFIVGGLSLVLNHSKAQGDNVFAEWRPNNETRGIRYVGNEACVECHVARGSQVNTPMAQAMEVAPDCRILNAKGRLTLKNGDYKYEISRQGKEFIYSVSDGINTISKPILYCFGQGHVGQTYLFRYNDILYETRVSYFQKIQNLDFTIGHKRTVPTSIDDALGRPIGAEETRQCFGCHSTGAVHGTQLKLDQLSAGIGCEACHGPGEKHVATAKAKVKDSQVFNPGILGGYEMSQSFCGTCHTGFEQAMLMQGQGGINNIRFQPYRMFNSRGHNSNDARIGCLACHNPHEKLQKDPLDYDSRCLACHLTTAKEVKTVRRTASACPVSTQKCVTCHMPKVDLPGMHAAFTDHWIRIPRPNEQPPR